MRVRPSLAALALGLSYARLCRAARSYRRPSVRLGRLLSTGVRELKLQLAAGYVEEESVDVLDHTTSGQLDEASSC